MSARDAAIEPDSIAAERYAEALKKIAALPCLHDCDVFDSRLLIDGDDCASCYARLVLGGQRV